MNVSDLNLKGLFETMRAVRAQMSSASEQRAMLNRARADTPIIDDIFNQIGLMTRDESPDQPNPGVDCAIRDLLIVLALRDIEREQREKGKSRLWVARK